MNWTLSRDDWQGLEVHEWRDWPLSAQRALIAAVALAVCVLLSLVLAWPMWRELRAAQSQGQQLRSQARTQFETAADWPQVKQQLAQAQAQWQALQKRFPRELQLPQALQTLEVLARAHHIRLHVVRVQGLQTLPSHRAQSIHVEASGDYHAWGRWMAALLDAEPLMWVSTLEAQADGARGVDVRVKMTVICAAQPMSKGSGS